MTIPQVPIQLMVETREHRADLYINGDITKGFQFFGIDFGQDTDTAYDDVVQALSDLPDEVDELTVHINSYGGEVAEGVAIYNALRSAKAKVTTVCEGFACSIASVVFMAGSERVMRPASLLMLHNASMGAHGDANDLRKAASDLDIITDMSKTAYLEHATEALTPELLTQVMDAETWVKPETALEWGLATEVDTHDDDADEPTQHVGTLVVERLTHEPTRPVFASVSLSDEQMGELIGSVIEHVAAHGFGDVKQGTVKLVADCEPEPEPAADSHVASQYARIFKQLAEKKGV